MSKSRLAVAALVAAAGLALGAGCGKAYKERVRLIEEGRGVASVETSGPETMEMPKPQIDGRKTRISIDGKVIRKADADPEAKPVTGFVVVQVMDDKGAAVDEVLLKLDPPTLAPGTAAHYGVALWSKDPEKAKLKIVFVDERDAKQFYSGEAWGAAGKSGTGGGSGASSGNWTRPAAASGGGFGYGVGGVGGVGGLNRVSGVQGVGR